MPTDSAPDGERVVNTSRRGGAISRYMPVKGCLSPSGPWCTKRNVPLGRRSISQTASGLPLGSHHCATCSAFVQASKTTVRGASNARVMTISRSDGVVTLAVFSLVFRASTACLLLFPVKQVIVEAGELLFPEAPIPLQPLLQPVAPCGDERARAPLRAAPTRHEPSALQDLEVVGDVRLAEVDRPHE